MVTENCSPEKLQQKSINNLNNMQIPVVKEDLIQKEENYNSGNTNPNLKEQSKITMLCSQINSICNQIQSSSASTKQLQATVHNIHSNYTNLSESQQIPNENLVTEEDSKKIEIGDKESQELQQLHRKSIKKIVTKHIPHASISFINFQNTELQNSALTGQTTIHQIPVSPPRQQKPPDTGQLGHNTSLVSPTNQSRPSTSTGGYQMMNFFRSPSDKDDDSVQINQNDTSRRNNDSFTSYYGVHNFPQKANKVNVHYTSPSRDQDSTRFKQGTTSASRAGGVNGNFNSENTIEITLRNDPQDNFTSFERQFNDTNSSYALGDLSGIESLHSQGNAGQRRIKRALIREKQVERQNRSQSRLKSVDFLNSIKHITGNVYYGLRKTFIPSEHRTQCTCDLSLYPNQSCSKAIGWFYKFYKQADLEYYQQTYENLQSITIQENDKTQISKDIARTHPEHECFKEGKIGYQILQSVLSTFSVYDPQVGYVQGMNFLAASFVYHSEQYVAFWLFVYLIQNFQMRDIYRPSKQRKFPQLPGLNQHIQIINMLIITNYPQLHENFSRNKIQTEMFCTQWIFSLFSSVISINHMDKVIEKLFEEGWIFFYQMVLTFIDEFYEPLLHADQTGMFLILTGQIYDSESEDYGKMAQIDWETLIKMTENIDVDSRFVNQMLNNYNSENQLFNINQMVI